MDKPPERKSYWLTTSQKFFLQYLMDDPRARFPKANTIFSPSTSKKTVNLLIHFLVDSEKRNEIRE